MDLINSKKCGSRVLLLRHWRLLFLGFYSVAFGILSILRLKAMSVLEFSEQYNENIYSFLT